MVQGGSSITQQMVKLTLLSQAKTEKELKAATHDTYARKVRELRYAIAFEQQYSKDWILERYLNLAYFGDGAYGIQAAARHYFYKDARNLNWRESSLLAGLVKNPTGFDPTNYPDRALERRNIVLDRMAQLNVISDEGRPAEDQMDLGLDVNTQPNGCVFSQATFFCDYVLHHLYADKALGGTPPAQGPAQVRRPDDPDDDRPADPEAADASVADHVYPTDQAIGGLAMVEPRTGDVKALSQSRPMGANRRRARPTSTTSSPSGTATRPGSRPGRRSRRSSWPPPSTRASRRHRDLFAVEDLDPDDGCPTCGGHNFFSTDVWKPRTPPTAAPSTSTRAPRCR